MVQWEHGGLLIVAKARTRCTLAWRGITTTTSEGAYLLVYQAGLGWPVVPHHQMYLVVVGVVQDAAPMVNHPSQGCSRASIDAAGLANAAVIRHETRGIHGGAIIIGTTGISAGVRIRGEDPPHRVC